MKNFAVAAVASVLGAASIAAGRAAIAQQEQLPTQVLVAVDPKSAAPPDAAALTAEVNGRKEAVTAWEPVMPAQAQVAILIDDGLRESVGREMDNLKTFIKNLPAGVEVMVGFMQYGRVAAEQGFTRDHAVAAASLRLPQGVPGASASPYICISDFTNHWPGREESPQGNAAGNSAHPARFVLMISNGVDPYNGSTSIMNQDSPYVQAAVTDAQRAGVTVYALYFSDAGERGSSADNSGQNYLSQLAQNTGGLSLWQGIGNPVSMAPFLKQFQQSLAATYIATFGAPAGRDAGHDLVRVKITAGRAKLHTPSEVLPGNRE